MSCLLTCGLDAAGGGHDDFDVVEQIVYGLVDDADDAGDRPWGRFR